MTSFSRAGVSEKTRENIAGYLFIAGFMVVYLVFTLWPIIDAFRISFCQWNIVGSRAFIGLANYKSVLQDREFWASLWHTIQFLLYSTLPLMAVSFLMAVLVNSRHLRARSLFRGVYFSPNVLTVTVISYVWSNMLSPYNGIVNKGLKALGLLAPGMRSQILWTTDPNVVWWSITLITLWWTMGYNMIMYLSAMQNIPTSIYEAAELDGATKWQQITRITLPLLRPTIITLLILQLGQIFRSDFGLFYQVPMNQGALFEVTDTIDTFVYRALLKTPNIGMSSAAGFIQSVVGFVFILAANGVIRKLSPSDSLF